MWESERASNDMADASKRIAELEGELAKALTADKQWSVLLDRMTRKRNEASEKYIELLNASKLQDCEVRALSRELERVNSERDTLLASVATLREALGGIVEFSDDPDGSEKSESLACGLARLLPDARVALANAGTTEALERVRKEAKVEALKGLINKCEPIGDEVRPLFVSLGVLEDLLAELRGGQ